MAQAKHNTIKTLGGSARGADSPPRKGRELHGIEITLKCIKIGST